MLYLEIVEIPGFLPFQEDYCHFLFNLPHLADNVIGVILLVISLAMLTACLFAIVKILRSALQG